MFIYTFILILYEFCRADAPLQNVTASSNLTNEDLGAGTPGYPEPPTGAPVVKRVPETVGGLSLAPTEEDHTRSVLQKKLTRMIVWMGRLGVGLAVLTVLALVIRFMTDHFLLTDKPPLWDWLYLQSFFKYIVIGMVVILVYVLVCWTHSL